MKFLLFNLIVAGALVHLFGIEPLTKAATEGTGSIAAYVDEKFDSSPAPKRYVPEENPQLAPAAVKHSAEILRGGAPASEALPPLTNTAPEVRPLPVHAIPSPAGSFPKAEPVSKAAKAANFFTPKQRWRELNRLAYDMELMYDKKVER